ncbi:GTPase/DUF3482 domain-containing protein [Denitromonas ohlonensis]|uniref:DUF3482 domain-containing protein n=2 Tax=Denitromonas TaxID=139331 RepID=A0A557S2D4_9RHOO|nr:GTPase/DUF3482 domain-containing protein [Denitromonas ohlonensis]TVO58361.1 DUF3482 domain-containing protein [Denitromonas ohlonensis]TVO71487.1 DUF3482 domain-containing protein [Denitromonas ohlonensis]
MADPIRIAVVGHTNTGKTSLLRTLLRDTRFGNVSDRPSTTRHVEGARLLADGTPILSLFDTPGMEDAIALLDYIDTLAPAHARSDGPERIRHFLGSAEARARYEQEAKVLRQLLDSDAAFYVVDVRDPVLPKHRDELTLLADCARPLLPVLNFVHAPESREAQWREALARVGLHAQVRFDTIAPELGGERRLYEALATLLANRRDALEHLIASRERDARSRHTAAARLVAELLIDIAATRQQVDADENAIQQAVDNLHQAVRTREQRCVDALLALYGFSQKDVNSAPLPLLDGRWEDDLFNPESLRSMGISLGKGAAAGAAAGVGIDLLAGGLTLGAAAALGAIIGGTWQSLSDYGDRLLGKLTGSRELTVDDAILRLLALRQQHLLRALAGRGHAALAPVELSTQEISRWRDAALPDALELARAHPAWSGLINSPRDDMPDRQQAIAALATSVAAENNTSAAQ